MAPWSLISSGGRREARMPRNRDVHRDERVGGRFRERRRNREPSNEANGN